MGLIILCSTNDLSWNASLHSVNQEQHIFTDVQYSQAPAFHGTSVWSDRLSFCFKLIKKKRLQRLTYCICRCRRSSNLFFHKGSLLFLIIHSAYVEMSVAALWSEASQPLAEPSNFPWKCLHTSHKCDTEIRQKFLCTVIWDDLSQRYYFVERRKKDDNFIFTSVLQLAAEMVFAAHRQQCCTERNCQQTVAFSERLLSAALLGCACTSGFSLFWSFSSCCLPVSFNRKALAALAQIRSSTSLHCSWTTILFLF